MDDSITTEPSLSHKITISFSFLCFLSPYRELLLLIDQWLYERHTISSVNVDLLFPAMGDREVTTPGGSVVREVISNPLHQAHVQPPEDTLVIALNNPMFSSTS